MLFSHIGDRVEQQLKGNAAIVKTECYDYVRMEPWVSYSESKNPKPVLVSGRLLNLSRSDFVL